MVVPMVRCSISCCVLWILLLLLITAAGVLAITAGILHSSFTSAQVGFFIDLVLQSYLIWNFEVLCSIVAARLDVSLTLKLSHTMLHFPRILSPIYI